MVVLSGHPRAYGEGRRAGAVAYVEKDAPISELREAVLRIASRWPAGAMAQRLDEYAAKRDFAATPEPAAARCRGARGAAALRDPAAPGPRLHWDLRLEHDGALASWALPKGLP